MTAPESLRDEVAAVLAEHAPIASCDEGEWHCECGPVRCLAADCDGGSWADCHAAHLADALLASPALARVIREAKAEAWDEGYLQADEHYESHRNGHAVPCDPLAMSNPYGEEPT